MPIQKILAPAAAAAALLCAPLASHAGLAVRISDGVTTTTIADDAAGDMSAGSGAISYLGAFGTWEITFAIATSVDDPLQMHLTAGVAGNAGDGMLTISVTDTDLTGAGAPQWYVAGGGGFGALGSAASWAAYVDSGNVAFGTGTTVFSSTGYGTGYGGQQLALNSPYSATLTTTFDYSGVSSRYPVGSSLDIGMNAPEPATLALSGLALLGLGIGRRRRKA